MNKKKNITKIYIVRHGESESNKYALENPDQPASHYGEKGASLTQKGREQADELAKRLEGVEFVAVFASELARAVETAEIIVGKRDLSINQTSAIRERFFGEPMSKVQKKEIEKALNTLTEEEKFAFKYFPNGESGYDVVNRVKQFLFEIVELHKNQTVLLVSHSYIMRSFLIHEKVASFDELQGGSISNAGYFVIETDGTSFTITEKHGINHNKGLDNEEQ